MELESYLAHCIRLDLMRQGLHRKVFARIFQELFLGESFVLVDWLGHQSDRTAQLPPHLLHSEA